MHNPAPSEYVRQGHPGNNRVRRPRVVNPARRSRQNFDSNGPGVRIRGTADQVYEKYVSLARDANSGGDYILAENLLQHAEHYQRMIASENEPRAKSAEKPAEVVVTVSPARDEVQPEA